MFENLLKQKRKEINDLIRKLEAESQIMILSVRNCHY